MSPTANLAVLLLALSSATVAVRAQAATDPVHPAILAATSDGSSTPWGYEQQRQKMMRQVNDLKSPEGEPQGQGTGECTRSAPC